jgi:hypothetical protein
MHGTPMNRQVGQDTPQIYQKMVSSIGVDKLQIGEFKGNHHNPLLV